MRRALAKAITLIESTRADHRPRRRAAQCAVAAHRRALRIGISGVPGVGKSTFIEALGLYLIEQRPPGRGAGGRSVLDAVRAAAILGDKTRMERLSRTRRLHPAQPQRRHARRRRREDARGDAGLRSGGLRRGDRRDRRRRPVGDRGGRHDRLLFVLLQLPNAGDDLQAIKKGIMELADIVVVNKADLDASGRGAPAPDHGALRCAVRTRHARHASAAAQRAAGEGVSEFWQRCSDSARRAVPAANSSERRRRQALAWMWERIDRGLRQRFREHPAVRAALPQVQQDMRRRASPVGAPALLARAVRTKH
jgi:LAO/AO transport system kinase